MKTLTKPVYYLDVLTATVLLYNIHKAAQSPVIGFSDTNQTLDTITRKLNIGRIMISKATLESGLWACNMLDEMNKFWHPRDLTFDDFVDRLITKSTKFNKIYNLIEEKE